MELGETQTEWQRESEGMRGKHETTYEYEYTTIEQAGYSRLPPAPPLLPVRSSNGVAVVSRDHRIIQVGRSKAALDSHKA